MRSFDYHRPTSLAEAGKAFTAAADAKLLGGGMTLIPAMKMRLTLPTAEVDPGAISELRGVKVEGGTLTIGPMTTHAAVASSKDVVKAIPALAQLAGGIGDPQVRN